METKYQIIYNYLLPLFKWINDDNVNEIMINRKDDVWVKKYGQKHEKINVIFEENQLKGLITLLASASYKEIGDEKSNKDTFKIVSAGMPGYRFEAWSKPVSIYGPSLTIRKLSTKFMTLSSYSLKGAMSERMANYLKYMVENKANILIAGSTGSGKTTFLNALIGEIPKHERLLVIETIPEISISNRNVLYLQADMEQGYSVNRLIESALRALPDRILIGELRGIEADGFLTVCNTGHQGSIATIHANSSLDVLTRLEDMVTEGRKNMQIRSVKKRIGAIKPLIVYLKLIEKDKKIIQALTEIIEITGISNNEYLFKNIV